MLARRGYVELVPVVYILNQMVLGQICLAPINHRKIPETDTHPSSEHVENVPLATLSCLLKGGVHDPRLSQRIKGFI